MTAESTTREHNGLRGRAIALVEDRRTQHLILAIIVINAITLGLETSATAMAAAGDILLLLDRTALAFFTLEMAVKLFAYRLDFFRSGWNVFDLCLVAIGYAPDSTGFTVLRALRILRAALSWSYLTLPGGRRPSSPRAVVTEPFGAASTGHFALDSTHPTSGFTAV